MILGNLGDLFEVKFIHSYIEVAYLSYSLEWGFNITTPYRADGDANWPMLIPIVWNLSDMLLWIMLPNTSCVHYLLFPPEETEAPGVRVLLKVT